MGTRAGDSRANAGDRAADALVEGRPKPGLISPNQTRHWRRALLAITGDTCVYCGAPASSIDHVQPLSQGGRNGRENCVPACLACNGSKGNQEGMAWYRQQSFYDPRRAMALRAWGEGDLRLAGKLLEWSRTNGAEQTTQAGLTGRDRADRRASPMPGAPDRGPSLQQGRTGDHQIRQANAPLWRWQIAS
jgi:hypothetical protein